MSTSYKKYITDDLSTKTGEELVYLQINLYDEKRNIEKEKDELSIKLRSCQKELDIIEKIFKKLKEEINRREYVESMEKIMNESCIKEIQDFELLLKDEIAIITKKMDCTDYRKYGVTDRFYDLKRICKEVIALKKRYPKWVLTDMCKRGQIDKMPPHSFYKYEYTDENDNIISIGGSTSTNTTYI